MNKDVIEYVRWQLISGTKCPDVNTKIVAICSAFDNFIYEALRTENLTDGNKKRLESYRK